MENIEIATERLILKPIGPEYLETMNEYALDRENTRLMLYMPHRNQEESKAFLLRAESEWKKERPVSCEFAILFQNHHVGGVSIDYDNEVGELGWIINRRYWGNGFAAEADRAVIAYSVSARGTTRFIAHCDTENTASRRVMEELGMVRTAEYGGRRNRSADRDSFEYQYELLLS